MAKKPSNRVRSETPITTIENWEQASQCLKQIGDLQQAIQAEEAKAKTDADAVQTALDVAVKPLAEEIKELTEDLKAFSIERKEVFGNAKSMKLSFGLIGWRASSTIAAAKGALSLIKNYFGIKAVDFIRVKEEPNKDALDGLTDEILSRVGCKRICKNIFFVEPDIPKAVDHEENKDNETRH